MATPCPTQPDRPDAPVAEPPVPDVLPDPIDPIVCVCVTTCDNQTKYMRVPSTWLNDTPCAPEGSGVATMTVCNGLEVLLQYCVRLSGITSLIFCDDCETINDQTFVLTMDLVSEFLYGWSNGVVITDGPPIGPSPPVDCFSPVRIAFFMDCSPSPIRICRLEIKSSRSFALAGGTGFTHTVAVWERNFIWDGRSPLTLYGGSIPGLETQICNWPFEAVVRPCA